MQATDIRNFMQSKAIVLRHILHVVLPPKALMFSCLYLQPHKRFSDKYLCYEESIEVLQLIGRTPACGNLETSLQKFTASISTVRIWYNDSRCVVWETALSALSFSSGEVIYLEMPSASSLNETEQLLIHSPSFSANKRRAEKNKEAQLSSERESLSTQKP